MPDTTVTPARDYFYAHLNDQTDECMIWPYSTTTGYGRVSLGGGVYRLVTTLACELVNGLPPQQGMQAAHGPCHNRLCWNPRHLSWKTRVENEADKRRDGTLIYGGRHSQARVTEADVQQIRDEYAKGGVRMIDLAQRYGLGRPSVSRIINRVTWAHI